MNSLNILSARVIGQPSTEEPRTKRPRSLSDSSLNTTNSEPVIKRSASQHVKGGAIRDVENEKEAGVTSDEGDENANNEVTSDELDEKTPLLAESKSSQNIYSKYSRLRLAAKRLLDVLAASLKWVLSTLASPGFYIITGFYDEKGQFSPLVPIRKLGKASPRESGRKSRGPPAGLSASADAAGHVKDSRSGRRKPLPKDQKRRLQDTKSSLSVTSESEADFGEKAVILDVPPESRPRPQTSSSSEEAPQTRRSIRIKLYNEDTTRRRKVRRERGDNAGGATSTVNDEQPSLTVANIKSPTSPASSLKMSKYPRAPAPPRPLIPRQQPSYSANSTRSSRLAQKTLVIDLDETLIHSLAKGGRMSSGHMVEVKLNTTVGYGGATLGPQHPILYYVHKRPHCDDFLRKVCNWYNLVVFTASVQEYADPVIDWLEQERKYFSGRFYRQHCTYRNGAYIKDLSSVEPDLSKVMILDNSPLSYIFHEGEKV